MPAFSKFNCFVEDLGRAKHNLDSDTLKVMLTNSAPSAANTVKGDITEISAGNGYSAGGTAVASNDYTQTSGTAKLTGTDVTFTASGGSIASWRYAVLYNDTSATDALIGYWDYGSSRVIASGESFPIDWDATNGILQVA